MTPADGWKAIQQLLGPQARFRQDRRAKPAAARAQAKEQLRECDAARAQASKAMHARGCDVLGADAEYQRLRADWQTLDRKRERLQGIVLSHRVTVGVLDGSFFMVEAKGDNWAEVVRLVQEKRQRVSA